MASEIERPTLQQIQQRVFADVRAELPGDEPTVPLSTEYAMSVAVAGASHLKHGRIDYAARQQLPDTADFEGVARWAGILGVPVQQPAKASGSVIAFGTFGSTISTGETLVFPNDDLTYTVTADATVPIIGQVEVFIEATETGAAYNLADKTILVFDNPPAGIDSETIAFRLEFGSDLETRDQLLERVLYRLQGGKLIGKPGDWEAWAREFSGVTRSWEVANLQGAGTVVVFFVFDNDPVSIFPTPTVVSTVEADIQSKAPTMATTIGSAPANSPLDLEISISPDTPDIRTSVELELEDMLLREATAKGFTLSLSKISEAISRAPGEESNTLISPTEDQEYNVGTIPTLGDITWS